jgi:hypothetical protein
MVVCFARLDCGLATGSRKSYGNDVDCTACDCATLDECTSKPKAHRKKNVVAKAAVEDYGANGAPWAVLNWTLRVGAERPVADATYRAIFAPLRERLDVLLDLLPKHQDVVFRGVDKVLAPEYPMDAAFLWQPFTSTSKCLEPAMHYLKGQRGTFFLPKGPCR